MSSDGNWVTINGVHVLIGGNGTITALKEKLNNGMDIKDEPL